MSINIKYPKQFSKEYKDFIIVLSKLSELKNIKNLPFEDGFIQSLKATDPEGLIPIKYYYNWIVDWKEICRQKKELS